MAHRHCHVSITLLSSPSTVSFPLSFFFIFPAASFSISFSSLCFPFLLYPVFPSLASFGFFLLIFFLFRFSFTWALLFSFSSAFPSLFPMILTFFIHSVTIYWAATRCQILSGQQTTGMNKIASASCSRVIYTQCQEIRNKQENKKDNCREWSVLRRREKMAWKMVTITICT